ncbi:MAG TPA: hypothetical protein VG992_04935 [Candidatus Saccharimonadales bacterium]|nr:hypothetical protein [Candidatus Saccharimonadales bacterium]
MNPPTLDQINYEPLQGMQHAWSAVLKHGFHGFALPLAVLVEIVGIAGAIVSQQLGLSFGPILLYFMYLTAKVKSYKNQVWEHFAAVNGWGLDLETPAENTIPPSIQFGHSRHFSSVIQAQFTGVTCDLLSYDCTTGSGKSSQTHYFTVAVILAPKPMPHALLTSKKSSPDVQGDFANGEPLKLEGNFDDYFSLQVEKGQEVDLLTVITPDVMQTLVQYDQAEDIELLGDVIYFILRGDKRTPTTVQQLIRSVAELSQQLQENNRLSTPVAPVVQTAAA